MATGLSGNFIFFWGGGGGVNTALDNYLGRDTESKAGKHSR